LRGSVSDGGKVVKKKGSVKERGGEKGKRGGSLLLR